MGIMVYAKYGRTGIYHIQELMRLLNENEHDMKVKVENTKAILQNLPESNWFKKSEHLFHTDLKFGDIGIYDLFLHSQDRAYTVLELHDFIESCGLHFIDYVSQTRLLYHPENFIDDQLLLEKIKKLDKKKQQAIAELLIGNIKKHLFYISNQNNTLADLNDLDNVPFLSSTVTANLSKIIEEKPGQPVTLFQPNGIKVELQPKQYTHLIFKYLDGKRSLKNLFAKVREELHASHLSDPILLEDFKPIYHSLNTVELLLLRDKSVDAFKTTLELQESTFKKPSIRL
jgi:hypothetical protein